MAYTMLHLPDRVKQEIIAQLDPSSLLNLACTCHDLQYHAEAKIWSTIDSSKYPINVDLYRQERPLSAHDYLVTISSALDRVPQRIGHIKAVHLAPHSKDLQSATHLLLSLASDLKRLHINHSIDAEDDKPLVPMLKELIDAWSPSSPLIPQRRDVFFPNLEILAVPIDYPHHDLVSALLANSTNIQHLTIKASKPTTHPHTPSVRLTDTSRNPLPRLSSLKIERLERDMIDFIVELLVNNPQIETFTIAESSWSLSSDFHWSPLIDTLRHLVNLRTLSFPDISIVQPISGGFTNLTLLEIKENCGDCYGISLEVCQASKVSETALISGYRTFLSHLFPNCNCHVSNVGVRVDLSCPSACRLSCSSVTVRTAILRLPKTRIYLQPHLPWVSATRSSPPS
jgi:hypothetical protein